MPVKPAHNPARRTAWHRREWFLSTSKLSDAELMATHNYLCDTITRNDISDEVRATFMIMYRTGVHVLLSRDLLSPYVRRILPREGTATDSMVGKGTGIGGWLVKSYDADSVCTSRYFARFHHCAAFVLDMIHDGAATVEVFNINSRGSRDREMRFSRGHATLTKAYAWADSRFPYASGKGYTFCHWTAERVESANAVKMMHAAR